MLALLQQRFVYTEETIVVLKSPRLLSVLYFFTSKELNLKILELANPTIDSYNARALKLYS
jgi:hypothetical protein